MPLSLSLLSPCTLEASLSALPPPLLLLLLVGGLPLAARPAAVPLSPDAVAGAGLPPLSLATTATATSAPTTAKAISPKQRSRFRRLGRS
jgi:hypothetical protein